MNIIEEVRKMDKIPVELIEAIADKIGEPGWREEGEDRGVNILIMNDEGTRNAFSGNAIHLLMAWDAAENNAKDDPKAMMLKVVKDFADKFEKEDGDERIN